MPQLLQLCWSVSCTEETLISSPVGSSVKLDVSHIYHTWAERALGGMPWLLKHSSSSLLYSTHWISELDAPVYPWFQILIFKEAARTLIKDKTGYICFPVNSTLGVRWTTSYADIPETWCFLMLLLHAATTELSREQGMGWALFIFQQKSAKEKLETALVTNFIEKGWGHLALLVATMCEALSVQHTHLSQMFHSCFSFSNTPALSHCLPWHRAAHKHLCTSVCCAERWLRVIMLPANLANILLEAWQPGERHKQWLRGGWFQGFSKKHQQRYQQKQI